MVSNFLKQWTILDTFDYMRSFLSPNCRLFVPARPTSLKISAFTIVTLQFQTNTCPSLRLGICIPEGWQSPTGCLSKRELQDITISQGCPWDNDALPFIRN